MGCPVRLAAAEEGVEIKGVDRQVPALGQGDALLVENQAAVQPAAPAGVLFAGVVEGGFAEDAVPLDNLEARVLASLFPPIVVAVIVGLPRMVDVLGGAAVFAPHDARGE